MHIAWLIAGIILGSILTSKIFLRKKMQELAYHREKELELFSSIKNDDLPSNENEIVNTKDFKKIPLKVNPEELNAVYENDFIIISFPLEIDDFAKFFYVSPEVSERYMQIIKAKIENGETVKLPKDVIDIDQFGDILQKGKVKIYSKEDKKNVDYILTQCDINHFCETASAIEILFCLPNGRVISKKHEGMICGIHKPA